MRKMLIAAMPILMVLSCMTIDKELLNGQVPFNADNELLLSADYDIAHIRADLRRNVIVKEKMDVITVEGKPKVLRTVTENKAPYHYVSLYFGEGIMLDMNKNLCVDLYKFYGLDKLEKFSMRRKSGRAGEAAISYEKDGDYFARKDLSLLGAKVTAEKDEDGGLTIEDGILKLKHTVTVDHGDVVLKQFGLGGTQGIYKTDSGEYMIRSENIKGKFTQVDEKTITWGKELVVSLRDDGSLLFTYSIKPAGTKTYTFIRTENGFVFFDKHYQGTEVIREGGVITVREYGRTACTYTVIE